MSPPSVGSRLQEGDDAVLLAYGPVLLHEALLGSERLAEQGIRLAVVNMPWLNYADLDWLTAEIAPYEHILVLDDHSPVGGLGDTVRRALDDRPVTVYGVEGWPACGTPEEASASTSSMAPRLRGESRAARRAGMKTV